MPEKQIGDNVKEIRLVAEGAQRLLAQVGDKLVTDTAPSIVLYKANLDPNSPDELKWHAGVVYRQHVAATPLIALKSLGQTLLSRAQELGALDAEGNTSVAVLKGGEPVLPSLDDLPAPEGEGDA